MSGAAGTWTVEERTAIGELLHLAEACVKASEDCERRGMTVQAECNRALGIIVISRAHSIIAGEGEPLTLTDEEVVEMVRAMAPADIPAQAKELTRRRRRGRES